MRLEARLERWPIAGQFVISRGAKSEAHVLVVELHDGGARGWGEGTPYRHFGESPDEALAAVLAARSDIERGISHDGLREMFAAGAVRSALDNALWDLESKLAGRPVWALLGLAEPTALTTAYTLSMASPAQTEAKAREHAARPLLKLKLGGAPEEDAARVAAARRGAPAAELIVDANEGWSVEAYSALAPELAALGVTLIEQPLAPEHDAALAEIPRPVTVCADEAFRSSDDIEALADRYDAVNIKLDKVGGLSSARDALARARAAGLSIMVGCHVGTSLSIAPAMLIAAAAQVVDLDAGLLLARDREGGVVYRGSTMEPHPALWGITS